MSSLTCFKTYDIRGKLGEELNESICYCVGRIFADYLSASCIAVGHDTRFSSESLKNALSRGIQDAGCDVIDIGLSGTEEIYFASMHLPVDGGIQVTASHNPIDYNGLKFIGKNGTPILQDSFKEIKRLAEAQTYKYQKYKGKLKKISILEPYVDHLLSFIKLSELKPLKLVVNAGNGAAGHVIDTIEQRFVAHSVPITFIKIHHQPDGTFPHGIPNPLLPENRHSTSQAVIEHHADMGIAWDGDFDRCFLFDEKGQFIEGYYIVGLLANAFLQKYPNENIVYDPRLTWNTIDIVNAAGGIPIQSKTGHAFIKACMRDHNAIYGGEMSAHHYFRDFAYCDSGMIPWLLVAELISIQNKPLSTMYRERSYLYPCSGEINYQVNDINTVLTKISHFYAVYNPRIDTTDGISLNFNDWRFNLRASNTEPLLRLNVESKNNSTLVKDKVAEIERLIKTTEEKVPC